MTKEANSTGFILGIVIISLIVGFIFGSAYGEGRMKRLVRYCADQHIDRNKILYCIQGVLDEEKEEVESSRNY